MGLAASQVNFLILTARKSDIGYELQRLSNTKEALTRDMQKVTRAYKEALSAKTLKWSANGGVSYSDLNYSTIMSQGATNDNSPLLITNSDGKVVLSQNYAKYAEMLDGGKYSDKRYKILSSLIAGVSEDKLKLYDQAVEDVATKEQAAVDADYHRQHEIPSQNYTPAKFISKLLSSVSYSKTEVLTPEKAEALSKSIQGAICGKGYFTEDMDKSIQSLCKGYVDAFKSKKDDDMYKDYKAENFINALLSDIMSAQGSTEKIHVMIDEKDGNRGTQGDYDAADAAYKQALADYQTAVGNKGKIFDSPTQKQIEFYDQLFEAIESMGWEEDSNVGDSEYLNQMLINNSYYLTTVKKNDCYNEDQEVDSRNYKYSYDTEFAENYKNIFKVNDSDAHEAAFAEYQAEKDLINSKESRIDTRMKNLETEQSAITQMLESINKIKNDNIERTFNLWS